MLWLTTLLGGVWLGVVSIGIGLVSLAVEAIRRRARDARQRLADQDAAEFSGEPAEATDEADAPVLQPSSSEGADLNSAAEPGSEDSEEGDTTESDPPAAQPGTVADEKTDDGGSEHPAGAPEQVTDDSPIDEAPNLDAVVADEGVATNGRVPQPVQGEANNGQSAADPTPDSDAVKDEAVPDGAATPAEHTPHGGVEDKEETTSVDGSEVSGDDVRIDTPDAR